MHAQDPCDSNNKGIYRHLLPSIVLYFYLLFKKKFEGIDTCMDKYYQKQKNMQAEHSVASYNQTMGIYIYIYRLSKQLLYQQALSKNTICNISIYSDSGHNTDCYNSSKLIAVACGKSSICSLIRTQIGNVLCYMADSICCDETSKTKTYK